MASTRYPTLVSRLGGLAAQMENPVPIRVYSGEPMVLHHGELSLWVDGDRRAWAGFGSVKTLVTAAEVVELIALADGACVQAKQR